MSFEPIAIVGQACLLPGAHSPQALWQAVAEGRDLLGSVPEGRWGLSPRNALGTPEASGDRTWSRPGGLRRARLLRRAGLSSSRRRAGGPGPPLPVDAGHRTAGPGRRRRGGDARTGAVMGNLSFPSSGLSRWAERIWLGDALADRLGVPRRDPRDRFMSGLPAHLLAEALGLGQAFALDAACASSLYAIKLACDQLQDRRADRMLAGAVNRADDLFIHVGFCALQALSKTGRSRPFHQQADGLVPAEGCGFVVLERLADAEARGARILGVIRGVGALQRRSRSGHARPRRGRPGRGHAVRLPPGRLLPARGLPPRVPRHGHAGGGRHRAAVHGPGLRGRQRLAHRLAEVQHGPRHHGRRRRRADQGARRDEGRPPAAHAECRGAQRRAGRLPLPPS